MSGISFKITDTDRAGIITEIETLGGKLAGDEAKLVAGTQLRETVQAYLFGLNDDAAHHRTATRFGSDRTGFYGEAADKTHAPELESDGVSVSIEKEGFAQRLFGGDIEGDPLLTIPARAEAVGHRARDFDNLKLIMFPSGAGALIERDASVLRGGKRGSERIAGGLAGRETGDSLGGLVFFWLVDHVHQEPDRSVLPTDEEMLEPIVERLRAYSDRVWKERKAA